MRILFKNIRQLVQVRPEPISYLAGSDMRTLPTIESAYLLVQKGVIKSFGRMKDGPPEAVDEVVDAEGRILMPTWCDSHTHLVYAGNREGEFVDRIKGLSYQEIAEKGGGILNSARALQETSEEDLYNQSRVRLEEVIKLGTGAIEIKSGYGLTSEAELKMLRVIQRLKEDFSLPIKSTFLAAHAVPIEYQGNKDAYLDLMIDEVLPIVAEQKLASYIDAFCETGYFTADEVAKILDAGHRHGLSPKVHVNQFNSIGGVRTCVEKKARSVDHLEILDELDIEALQLGYTMPTSLPNCSFFLGLPYTPARRIINAGLPLALASDYNPGSSPSGNMNLVVSIACIKMRMTPEEAINAATINSAYAMGLEDEVGSIAVGKKANLILTRPMDSYAAIPYAFGTNPVESVYLGGKKWSGEGVR